MTENFELISACTPATIEIDNFEHSELISNQEIAEFLQSNIPIEHLEGCPRIEFNPKADCFAENPNALGCFNTVTNEIFINSHESLKETGGLLETLTHEIGHNAHAQLEANSPLLADKWAEIYENSLAIFTQEGTGFVSEYALTNQYEDFAESYNCYVNDPEALAFFAPEKYAFMDKFIFHGQNSFLDSIELTEPNSSASNYRCFDIVA